MRYETAKLRRNGCVQGGNAAESVIYNPSDLKGTSPTESLDTTSDAAMPRTRAQRRATDGLFVLGDDALRNVLTFLTPSVCALGPGAASRALRELTTSRQLQVARKSGSYTLRPPDNGVVHALATEFGTREWPTRTPGLQKDYIVVLRPRQAFAYVYLHRRCASKSTGSASPIIVSETPRVAQISMEPSSLGHL